MSLQALVKGLADPLSAEGTAARAALREGDAQLFDALLGETVIEEGEPDVRGPLREVCHRSISSYDGLYDTVITDSYVYAQPLIEVLAAAPPGSRAAALRDGLTSLRLLYDPPTTFPEHRVDLEPLSAFPRLGSLEVEYPCQGGRFCGALRTLGALSLTRGFDALTLPPWLTRLTLLFPAAAGPVPAVELGGALSRSLGELTVDAACAAALAGLESLSGLRSLTHLVAHRDTGEELSSLLLRVSPTLESLRVKGVTAPRVRVPSRLGTLRRLDLFAFDLVLETLPGLRSATLAAWDRLAMSDQPALRELTVHAGTDLRALSACPALEVLTIDFFAKKATGPFPPELPALRELVLLGGEDLSDVPCYPHLQVIRCHRTTRVETLPEALRARVVEDAAPVGR